MECRLGKASNEITGVGRGEEDLAGCGRPTLTFDSALVHHILSCSVCVEDS